MNNIKAITNKLLFAALILGSVASCTKIIDVEVDPSNEKLVVDATLTTDTTVHIVKLTRTIDFFSMEEPPGVSNATVTVSDNEGKTITFEENQSVPGEYLSPENTYGVIGNTYTLNIELTSPIGGFSKFEATNFIKKTPEIDSVTIEKDPYRPFYYIAGYFQDSVSEDYYMSWYSKDDTLRNYLSSERYLIEDKIINGEYFEGAALGILFGDEAKFIPGSRFEVSLSNINEIHYNFITDFAAEASGQNPLFSGPPANISTNLNNDAVGFFATYSTQMAVYIVPAK